MSSRATEIGTCTWVPSRNVRAACQPSRKRETKIFTSIGSHTFAPSSSLPVLYPFNRLYRPQAKSENRKRIRKKEKERRENQNTFTAGNEDPATTKSTGDLSRIPSSSVWGKQDGRRVNLIVAGYIDEKSRISYIYFERDMGRQRKKEKKRKKK